MTEPIDVGHRSKPKRLGRELTLRLLYAMDAGGLTLEEAWVRCTQVGALLFEGLEKDIKA